jgi:hypothetical protein
MDENPYRTPLEDLVADEQPEDRRRALAASLSLLSLGISGYFLYWVCVGTGIAVNKSPSGFFPFDCLVLFFAVLPANAASWLATAWAVWRWRVRLMIVTLLMDVVLFVLFIQFP